MEPEIYHQPVLVKEVIEGLVIDADGFYIDCTLGEGGQAAAILSRLSPQGSLLGIDRDPEVLDVARRRLSSFSSRVHLVPSDYRRLTEIIAEGGYPSPSGILFDLGLSSFQLSQPERGFSFSLEGPLDMRFNREEGVTACELVNRLTEGELLDLIRKYGEEPAARRIARAIVSYRRRKPIETTVELSRIIVEVVKRKRWRIHPATRTFQALRIAVNEELLALDDVLAKAIMLLKKGGRVVVISFHSIEDRIVKEVFRRLAKVEPPLIRLLNKKVIRPGSDEVKANPRARSARMRVAERL
jgi:16S rRNA (cytosine1402-N4)-methyltransferase